MIELLTTGFYVSPKSFIVLGIVFPVLAAILVPLRFWSRIQFRLGVKADDWLCLPAFACVITGSALFIWGAATKQLLGYRLPPGVTIVQLIEESPQYMSFVLVMEYAMNPICAFGSGMIRLSFLFYYRRIFRGSVFKAVNWTMICLFSVWIIVILTTFFSVCVNHLPGRSESAVQQEQCRDLQGALAIIGFIFDLIVMTMPFPWIWGLQMPVTQKLLVSSVFLIGFFTVGASAVRMVIGIDAMKWRNGTYIDIMGLKSTTDLMGNICVTIFWSYIELGTGMAVCCLPSLGPFVHSKTMQKLFASLSLGSSSKSLRTFKTRARSVESGSDTEYVSDREKTEGSIVVTRTVDQYQVPV